MTLQQLRYLLTVVECGTISEAAKRLYITQPMLSNAIKDLEQELNLKLLVRGRMGVALTPVGLEFSGYARQVVQQMELLEDHFISHRPPKTRFAVSTQHYTFTTNAFVDLVKQFGKERYEFVLNETRTHQIIADVKNRVSDVGILYLCRNNEAVITQVLSVAQLTFYPLFNLLPD